MKARPCLLALALTSILTPAHAEETDVIRVESTTIDDRFDSKRTEASSINVISGDTVDAAHVENIQQVLQGVPGITTEFDSGDTLKIHLRGVENQVFMGEKPGVAIVIDGVPVFERTGRVNIDLDNIESIKVVKGGASYLFGDDALSGAVIITTKRGAKRAGYRIGGEYGSFGYWKGLASAGFSGESANGHVQLSHRESDGYYDDSGYEADYLNGKLQYYFTDTSDLTFGFEHSERMKNSHGSVKGVTAAEEDPKSENPDYNDYANHYDVSLDKYYLTYAMDLANGANWMVNGYTFGDQTAFLSSPVANTSDYNYSNDYDQAQRGIKSEYRAGSETFGWMVAADLRDNSYKNKTRIEDCTGIAYKCTNGVTVGSLSSNNETAEKVQAAYGELKYRVANPLVVTLNGRYDHIALDYTDNLNGTLSDDKSFDVTSWRLGGNYAVRENLDFYANASTGFRAPSVEQLFAGTNSPTHRADPNPDLNPEYSLNTEFGLRTRVMWDETPVEIDMTVFQLERTDHIQSSAGQYTTNTNNKYDNVGDLRNQGLELAVTSDPQRAWSWELAYTYLTSEYTKYDGYNLRTEAVGGVCPAGTTAVPLSYGPFPRPNDFCLTEMDLAGNKVPRVSAHHLNLAGHYRPQPGWLVTAEMDAISDYYADETNMVKIDGRETYNLLVNYDFGAGAVRWSTFARIDNLLDEQYYNTARGTSDSNNDGVFDEEDISIVVNQGRTYTVGVSAAF